MPHLQFSTFAGQIFWLVLFFTLLYIIVARVILPTISGVVEARGKVVSNDLADAETAKNAAEVTQKKYDKLLAENSEKARKLIDDSSAKAKAALEAKRSELSKKLDEKMKKAEKDIAKLNVEAEEVVAAVSEELAKNIVQKISTNKNLAA